MNTQTLEEFKLRLAQTIFWCASRANTMEPESCLRTPALRPRLLAENRFEAVNSVVDARKWHAGPAVRDTRIPGALGGGRLLIYFPETNLFCGAAEQQTERFFDVDNVPPWDTWVSYLGRSPRSGKTQIFELMKEADKVAEMIRKWGR